MDDLPKPRSLLFLPPVLPTTVSLSSEQRTRREKRERKASQLIKVSCLPRPLSGERKKGRGERGRNFFPPLPFLLTYNSLSLPFSAMHFKIFNLPPCSSPLLFPFFSSCRFSFPVRAVRCEEENAPRPPPAASPRHLDACARVAFSDSGDAVCETFRGSHQQLADYYLLTLTICLRFSPLYRDQEDRRSGYFCRPPSAPLPSSHLPFPPLFLSSFILTSRSQATYAS